MNTNARGRRQERASRGVARQRGVVMYIALVVLIIMTLAGLAMLRQMGSGQSIAGNVAFKQNATSVADSGTEAALAWMVAQMTANMAALDVDTPASGYYSNWDPSVDPSRFDWSNGRSAAVTLDAGTNNEVRYVVHRLCEVAGLAADAATQRCSQGPKAFAGESKGGADGAAGVVAPPGQPFYQVTTRVAGPRNTVSYIQVVLH